jgi:hypothetical protein
MKQRPCGGGSPLYGFVPLIGRRPRAPFQVHRYEQPRALLVVRLDNVCKSETVLAEGAHHAHTMVQHVVAPVANG